VGVIERENDAFPAVLHDGAGNGGEGADNFQRHERLNIIVSFFDLGAGGQADAFCALLRDGLSIRQNQEQLMLNGFAFVSCGTPVAVPSLLKERWQFRVDLPVQLRRAIARSYPVDNLLKAAGTIEAAFSSGIEKELPFETPNQQG
jgi:hypothetical protein